ncbi:hypothetical protein [Bradyrhizobium sp. USDA 4506]
MAEGQPRNILDIKLSRFGGCCRVLSRRRHRVIHNCYAFSPAFSQSVAHVARRGVGASIMLNDAQTADAQIFINSKPRRGLARCG